MNSIYNLFKSTPSKNMKFIYKDLGDISVADSYHKTTIKEGSQNPHAKIIENIKNNNNKGTLKQFVDSLKMRH